MLGGLQKKKLNEQCMEISALLRNGHNFKLLHSIEKSQCPQEDTQILEWK